MGTLELYERRPFENVGTTQGQRIFVNLYIPFLSQKIYFKLQFYILNHSIFLSNLPEVSVSPVISHRSLGSLSVKTLCLSRGNDITGNGKVFDFVKLSLTTPAFYSYVLKHHYTLPLSPAKKQLKSLRRRETHYMFEMTSLFIFFIVSKAKGVKCFFAIASVAF